MQALTLDGESQHVAATDPVADPVAEPVADTLPLLSRPKQQTRRGRGRGGCKGRGGGREKATEIVLTQQSRTGGEEPDVV